MDRWLAAWLSRAGYRVVALSAFEGWNDYSATVSRHDRQSIQSVSALKELEAWLESPFHVIGASLGAMYGLQAFSANPQAKSLVLAVGGENFAGTITDSLLPLVIRNKVDRQQKYNLKTDQDYEQFMRKNFFVDPGLALKDEDKSDKYLLFLSESDYIVPTRYQLSLAAQLPRAQIHRFRTGHLTTIFRAYFLYQNEILSFLGQRDSSGLEGGCLNT